MPARIALGHGPSPVGAAPQLSPDLWVKDEGAYGDGGWGGNKVRKLEYTLADAKTRGKRAVLTYGGYASNHALATALYAHAQGLGCILCLAAQPMDEHARAISARIDASGAAVHRYPGRLALAAGLAAKVLRHRPYVLPLGGSSPLGVLGAADCARELAEQVPQAEHVVVAAGSGGTAAGLLVGLAAAGSRAQVVALLVNDKTPLDAARVVKLARRAAELHPARPQIDPSRLRWETEWLGGGYGEATLEAEAAIELTRHKIGLQLEPVYTGKAMAGLLELRRRGDLQGPTVFLRTNGPR